MREIDVALSVRVGGRWLHGLGYWGDLTYSHTWPGGCGVASWSMDQDPNFTDAALRNTRIVGVWEGTRRVWLGTLTESDRGAGTYNATGLSAQGKTTVCLDATGAPTSNPQVAVQQGIARGALSWTLRNDQQAAFDTPFVTTAATSLNYVSDILDAYCTANGQRWGVDADGALVIASDPTAPSWIILPSTGVMGVADDDYYTDLYGRYVSGVDATTHLPNAWSPVTASAATSATAFARREATIDLTALGLMDAPHAQALVSGPLTLSRARMGWTDTLEPSGMQIATLGGTPAHLPYVKAGQMVRVHGVLDADGNLNFGASVSVVIGESTYTGPDSITLAPVGLVPRTLSDVIAAPSAPETAFVA